MLFLGVTMMSQARADYVCTGEKNDKLIIDQTISMPQTRLSIYDVNVTYIDFDQDLVQTFNGEYLSSTGYEVFDTLGKNVNLKVVTPISHGGRCGRCIDSPIEPKPKKPTYAKITINDVELNFTCKLQ